MTTMKTILDEIEELPWPQRMPRGLRTAAAQRAYVVLRAKAGKVVMARTAAAGEAEEQALVKRLTEGGEEQ